MGAREGCAAGGGALATGVGGGATGGGVIGGGVGRGGANGIGVGALAIGPGDVGGVTGGVAGLPDAPGTNGGADGPVPAGGRGGMKAADAGVPNSGIPPVGDGGVAVAVTGPDSSLRRGGVGISAARVGVGAGGGGGGVYGRAGAAVNGGAAWADGAGAGGVAVPSGDDVGVLMPVGAGMVMTPLQTEHRARTPLGGTLAGSTRKIERQSGQLTFIHSLRSCERHVSPATAPVA